jgi:hypothetical protein
VGGPRRLLRHRPPDAEIDPRIYEGIAEPDAGAVRLTQPLGRLLVRVVAAVFDRYLTPTAFHEGLAPRQSSRVG